MILYTNVGLFALLDPRTSQGNGGRAGEGNQVSRVSNPKIGLDASGEQSGPYFSAFHMTSIVPEKVLTIFSFSLPCTLYILNYKSCTCKAYCHFAIGVSVLLNIPCFISGI